MFEGSAHAGDELRRHSDALAEAIVARQYSRQPKLWEPYGDRGRDIAVRDALYHLDMLADATSVNESALFVDYVSWAKVLFHHLGFPAEGLSGTLRCTYELVEQSPLSTSTPPWCCPSSKRQWTTSPLLQCWLTRS